MEDEAFPEDESLLAVNQLVTVAQPATAAAGQPGDAAGDGEEEVEEVDLLQQAIGLLRLILSDTHVGDMFFFLWELSMFCNTFLVLGL